MISAKPTAFAKTIATIGGLLLVSGCMQAKTASTAGKDLQMCQSGVLTDHYIDFAFLEDGKIILTRNDDQPATRLDVKRQRAYIGDDRFDVTGTLDMGQAYQNANRERLEEAQRTVRMLRTACPE